MSEDKKRYQSKINKDSPEPGPNVNISTGAHVKEVRLNQLATELLNGRKSTDIAEEYAEKWGIQPSTVRHNYINDARKLIIDSIADDQENFKKEILAKYMHLYDLAMRESDRREARMVLNGITDLIKTIDVNVRGFTNIQTIELVEVLSPDAEDIEHEEIENKDSLDE